MAKDDIRPPLFGVLNPDLRVHTVFFDAEQSQNLLVEDDPDTRASLYQLLTQDGYSVLGADNGQQALDLLNRGIRPSLIIVDLMLPRVSGFDLITYYARKRIRARYGRSSSLRCRRMKCE